MTKAKHVDGRLGLGRDHPQFDLGMELLCSIGRDHAVNVRDLAMELEITVKELARLARALRERGLEVRVTVGKPAHEERSGDRRLFVWVEPWAWPQVKAAAQAYWNAVHGDEA